ncbi:MAG: succinylglutamate desuccinylase/aspartoacylase family protein [Betaproteobacteria bacterium]|nr:succinylglutamate desuccinylase/aspartoacylase family protein [Betaproteobacteria bacterium]
MKIQKHPLLSTYAGTAREIVSFHYGNGRAGEKIYIQSSLHADELPGMLVAHHLRKRFSALEAAGKIVGEIVVVPIANPVGLAQTVLHNQLGRFELGTGENFNRHYPAMYPGIAPRVEGKLGSDPALNRNVIRQAMHEELNSLTPKTELHSMRQTLMRLACDADVSLDLHCDADAVVHLYTGTPMWPQCEPLARYMGAYATLLATESGDNPFDEACSQTWWQMEEHVKGRFPIPMACLSVTVELRGQTDVAHEQAATDANAIVAFLTHRGVIDGDTPPLPDLKHPATPLAGSEAIEAPISGVVTFARKPGDWIKVGDVIGEVIDPITAETHPLTSNTEGVLYARENRYFATAGMRLAKVAGARAFRTGKLLSA